MAYIYETHLHTSEASKCGKTAGKDYIDFMIHRGYAGMIVTDHFFNGNTCIDQSIPWKKRVDLYCSGFEHAKKAAEGKDFTVLFGVEFRFEGDEYLIYGISPKWLKNHEEIMKMNRKEVYELVHTANAIMVQAHPYRERHYISTIHLMPEISDGIEIVNAGNEPYMNALAIDYAKQLDVPVCAGSDIHILNEKPMAGMAFDHKIETIEQFVDAFMARKGTPVILSQDRVVPVDEVEELQVITRLPSLPVVYDAC